MLPADHHRKNFGKQKPHQNDIGKQRRGHSADEHNVEDITQLNIKQKTLTINKHENVPKFLGALIKE